ncbi:hypothetical protein L0657_20260 [Dyadobacter sp. CY345]|uniref:hypothetical protein n=1 Tax=Dyadobacter sp. CY345 TaxID=2909335 RepID=UPI001F2ABCBC|nr:hypothetical protein [Dyadobacter sp. CY345]MCF2446303.1 hypothetical protein [Dyadobacter sp. CY345]
MPKLEVSLTKSWNSRVKKIHVFCDDLKLGTVLNGESSEFEVATGTIKIKIKSGWYGSQELSFSLTDNQRKSISVDIFEHGNLVINSLYAVLSIHFISSVFFDIQYLIWFIIPAFLIVGYFLTFGRNDYLVIKEKQEKIIRPFV